MKKVSLIIALVLILCTMLSVNVFAQTVTDSTQNVTFTVPDGWSRDNSHETGECRFAFVKDGNNFTFFAYVVHDCYADLSASEQKKVKRSDFDNSVVTVEQFRKNVLQTVDGDKVSNFEVGKATFAGKDYFKSTLDLNTDGIIAKVVIYAHVFNGYQFLFAYEVVGEVNEEELNSVMNSVSFNSETKSNKVMTDTEKTVKRFGKGALEVILRGGGIAAVTGLGALFARARVRRREKKAEKNNPYNYNPGEYGYIPQSVPNPHEQQPFEQNFNGVSQQNTFTAPSQPVQTAADGNTPWICPGCSASCVGKFCQNCGTPRP